jgi:tetratricopeptide (TPR) repeat protein
VKLPRTNALKLTVELKLVGYAPGSHDLGSIEVEGIGHSVTQPLGSVALVDAYHPPFFREPFESTLKKFDGWLERAEMGTMQTVIVTGVGGSGKTRLCTEFSIEAERLGARCISLSHPQSADDPYRLLTTLLLALLPPGDPLAEGHERLVIHLRRHHAALEKRARGMLATLFRGRRAKGDKVDLTVVTSTLLALILDRAASEMLFIHLSDMHWAHSDVLHVLRTLIDRVRALRQDATARLSFVPRIMFVLEGRRMELHHRGMGSAEETYSTVAWEAFTRNRSTDDSEHVVTVRPLTDHETERFLRHVFENTETTSTRVPKRLIPHQNVLINEIQRRAAGSPLYVIEYIRLLRSRDCLATVPSTGLVYLCRRIDESLEVPEKVEGLIRRRLDYLREDDAQMALLIRAVAFIKDRVPRVLFEKLRGRLAGQATIDDLLATDFLTIPASRTADVLFRHESYYHTIAASELTDHERDVIAAVYLEWLERQPDTSAETHLDRGLVLEQTPEPARDAIEHALTRSLQIAEATSQDGLTGRALEHLIPLFPSESREQKGVPASDFLRLIEYRTRLARLHTNAARWLPAREQVTRVSESLSEVVDSAWRGSREERDRATLYSAQARVHLANIELHLLRADVAISTIEELLQEERYTSVSTAAAQYQAICAEGRNRLGVALWFDGQHERARKIFQEGLKVARGRRDPGAAHWLTDLGAVQIQSAPAKAVHLLTRAVKASPDRRSRGLATYERAMAELVLTERQRISEKLRMARLETIERTMSDIYSEALDRGDDNNEAGAALVAGVAAALLDRDEAIDWLMRAIAVAARDQHFEFLWKAHLNLAQIALVSSRLRAGAELHAQEAERIIRRDLDRRTSRIGEHRLALMGLPLTQLHRIWQDRRAARAERLRRDYAAIDEYIRSDGSLDAGRRSASPIVHVSHGDADYFLIS